MMLNQPKIFMKKKPYLSICIPTYNRLEILNKTIESIYADLNGINMDDFEVIISDNEPNHSAKKIIDAFNHENLYYYTTASNGFLNSYDVLKFANGSFLKLNNNYTMFRNETLKKLINHIKEDFDNKSVIFYTNGLSQFGKTKKIDNYNEFMYQLSYLSSWSSGFGFWKEDLESLPFDIKLNNYFPQTSLLMTQTQKSNYIINDIPLFDNQAIPKKGGYNIFKVFSVDFLSLIEEGVHRNEISKKTFNKIKYDLLIKYLSVRFFKTVIIKIDNFEKSDIRKNIEINYSKFMYFIFIFTSLFTPFKIIIRKIKIYSYLRMR